MNIYRPDGWNIRKDSETIELIKKMIWSTPFLADHLSEVTYQNQEWSFGGAVHFTGVWSDGTPVFIKIGAFREEVEWTEAIARSNPRVVPQLFGRGMELAELNVGWLVTEMMPWGTLGPLWGGSEFRILMEAGVRFQKTAQGIELPCRDYGSGSLRAVLERAVKCGAPGNAQTVLDNFDEDWAWMIERCPPCVCHGDLHLANALSRRPAPDGPAVLVDLQPTLQPWALDAAYCESLQAGSIARPGSTGLVPVMAELRVEAGLEDSLPTPAQMDRIERLALGWMALRRWQNPGADRADIEICRYISAQIENMR